MDLVTNIKRPSERKNVQNVLTVSNLLRIIFTSNDDEALMRVPEKDRKWQWVEASSHRRGQVFEYFVPLMAAIRRPGVQRAYYEYLMAIDITDFNFMKERAHCKLYEYSKFASIPQPVRFMRDWVLEYQNQQLRQTTKDVMGGTKVLKKATGKLTVQTEDLFNVFCNWESKQRSSGGGVVLAKASWSKSGFSRAIAKIPGVEKNASHGAGSSYHIHTVQLIDRLIELTLLVPLEKEWVLGTNTHEELQDDSNFTKFPKFKDYAAKVENLAIEEQEVAAAATIAATIAADNMEE
jgi:hypothetical protein